MPFALTVDPTSPEGLGTEPARAMLIPSSQILEEPGLGTILGAVRAEREITGQKPSISAIFGCQFPAYQTRTRARAAGFPREGRKPQRRRRDKRADRPFAKIKELFTKIMRLS